MKNGKFLGTRVAQLLAMVLFTLPATSWAADRVNPVTGEKETYINVFTGGTAEWNAADHWDTGVRPYVSGGGSFDAALVPGKTVSTSTAIEGWTLRVGAYDGASVTWSGGITKIQAGSVGCWLTADETSSITITSFAGNQLEGSDSAPFKLTSANAGGITWQGGLTQTTTYWDLIPFWYYLGGEGTVVYGGDITVSNAQVIKQADITLSGEKSVRSKTLVSFGSGTTKTFTADALINVKNSSDVVVATVDLYTVNTTGTTTLTTSDSVGTCELVQTSTDIVLYWVDGNPEEVVVVEKTYKPSININFTDSGKGLATGADVGLEEYAVPGRSWNNFAGKNATYGTVKAVDATGVASEMAGVSITISGANGSYDCLNLVSATNLLHGYIDESSSQTNPTVTVTHIPYYKYRVIVYHSTDSTNLQFGYDTINGTDYTYVNGELTEGTTSWGNSGAQDGANAIAEGVNVLVTGEISGPTLTVVGHRIDGDHFVRGCIAAIHSKLNYA